MLLLLPFNPNPYVGGAGEVLQRPPPNVFTVLATAFLIKLSLSEFHVAKQLIWVSVIHFVIDFRNSVWKIVFFILVFCRCVPKSLINIITKQKRPRRKSVLTCRKGKDSFPEQCALQNLTKSENSVSNVVCLKILIRSTSTSIPAYALQIIAPEIVYLLSADLQNTKIVLKHSNKLCKDRKSTI